METDRDVLRRAISLQTDEWAEEGQCIIVTGGPKYRFLDDGTLKSIKRDGRYYYPGALKEGKR